jgi:hypothetical protein
VHESSASATSRLRRVALGWAACQNAMKHAADRDLLAFWLPKVFSCTAGSPQALTPPTCKTPGRCWRSGVRISPHLAEVGKRPVLVQGHSRALGYLTFVTTGVMTAPGGARTAGAAAECVQWRAHPATHPDGATRSPAARSRSHTQTRHAGRPGSGRPAPTSPL